mgnify:CR=1 FL=1
MSVRLWRGDAAAGSALQKTVLHQEWLVHFLDGLHVFAHCSGHGSNSHRSAVEFLDDCLEAKYSDPFDSWRYLMDSKLLQLGTR